MRGGLRAQTTEMCAQTHALSRSAAAMVNGYTLVDLNAQSNAKRKGTDERSLH